MPPCLLICSDMDKRDTEDIRIVKHITRSGVPRKIVRQLETMKANHWIKVFTMGCFAKPCLACFVGGSQFVSECKKPHEELHDKTRLFKAELAQMKAVCICAWVVLQKLQNILLKVLCKMLVFPSIAHYSSLHILPWHIKAPCIEKSFCTWLVSQALLAPAAS